MLKTILLYIIIYTAFFFTNSSNDGKALVAVKRADNSFVTYSDTISAKEKVPVVVSNKVISIAKTVKNIAIIFKVDYDTVISLYIAKTIGLNKISYHIIAYNKNTNKVADHPQTINGKWMENNEDGFAKSAKMLKEPLIYFAAIDAGSKKNIIVKERVHNGNVYNAVIEHVYSINSKPELKPVVCVETKCINPVGNEVITRYIQNGVIFTAIPGKGKAILLGKITLDKSFKISSRSVYKKPYADMLITGSGVAESVFLKEGYRFRY
jgi:hypothetical protein